MPFRDDVNPAHIDPSPAPQGFALLGQALLKYFQTGVTYMATPFVSVILLGIIWKRINYPGALAGLVGGLVIQIGLALALWALDVRLNWLYIGSIAQVLTMLLIVGVTLRTAPARRDIHAISVAASRARSVPTKAEYARGINR